MMKKIAFGLFVSSMEEAVPFYEAVMHQKSNWDGGAYAEIIVDDTYQLMLYLRSEFEQLIAQTPEYPTKVNGTMEIALNYPNYDDVDQEFERLLGLGATAVMQPKTMPWGQRTGYLADKDGNLIEIGSTGREEG